MLKVWKLKLKNNKLKYFLKHYPKVVLFYEKNKLKKEIIDTEPIRIYKVQDKEEIINLK